MSTRRNIQQLQQQQAQQQQQQQRQHAQQAQQQRQQRQQRQQAQQAQPPPQQQPQQAQQSSDSASERGADTSPTAERIARLETTIGSFGRLLETITQQLADVQHGGGGSGGATAGVVESSVRRRAGPSTATQEHSTGRLGAADLRPFGGSRHGRHDSSSGAVGTPARGRGPEREFSHHGGHGVGFDPVGMHGVMLESGGFASGFKPKVPEFSGKESDFERFRQSFITYARHLRLDHVFTGDAERINVGDSRVSMLELSLIHI